VAGQPRIPATAGDPAPRAVLGATYDDAFFAELEDVVESSARRVVPLLCALLEPRSVLDVGCGRGTWLRVFEDHGVEDFVGVDGGHVAADTLEIAPSKFRAHDLESPLDLGRRFDLVVSLEVAEHLGPQVASAFVGSLVSHAPAVLFSAAIPYQGGPGHVNEAWQSEWAARFAEHGFAPLDVIRPEVWRDERVAFWYAQNTILYTDAATRARVAPNTVASGPLDVVHPRLHERIHTTPPPRPAPLSLSRLLRELPAASSRAVKRRWRGR
jgi:SAM-dependent methyltransferase